MASTGVYAPDKALVHRKHLEILKAGGQPYPVHLHLILSDLCNLSCVDEDGIGCAYRTEGYSSNQLFAIFENGVKNNNPNRMLGEGFVKDVIDDFVTMGGKAVEFTGGGEPTVHPQCGELVAYALDRGLDTALITNGILLRKKIPAETIARLTWLRLSIDAATPEMFGRVRPGLGAPHPENFGKVLEALSWARKACDDAKSSCVIGAGFVVQKANWREIYDAVRVYRDAGAHNVRISGLFSPAKDRYFDGWREEAEALERRAVADFSTPEFKVHGRLHEKVADLTAPPDYSHCAYENFTTYLGGDGRLYRCCVTAYNDHGLIGDVAAAGGFKALWDSQGKKDRFSSFDARTCEQCQFSDRNRSINASLEAPELPAAPDGVVHGNFV